MKVRHLAFPHLHSRSSGIFEQKITKARKHIDNIIYMLMVHSSTEQNQSFNFETLRLVRAVKSPTVVIFEDPKHIRRNYTPRIFHSPLAQP